jgi:hypothetical protein
MKVVRSIVLTLICLVAVSSCFDPPEFSDKPKIRIQDIAFINGPPLDDDTIKLTLFFQDGDGNLGLRNEESDYPYQSHNIFFDKNGELFNAYELEDADTAMRITRKRSKTNRVPGLPDFEPPTDCLNYKVDSVLIDPDFAFLFDSSYDVTEYDFGNGKFFSVKDTLYVEPNPNHFNIDVSIWVKCQCEDEGCCPDVDDQGYYEFQFAREPWPVCGEGFNGRFPYIARDNESPTEGTIAYSIKSIGFETDIGLTTSIRIKAKIRDRALNVSNEVISAPFTLSEKTRR